MSVIEQAKKIVSDVLAEYKARIFEISVKKQKIVKAAIDKMKKDALEDLRKSTHGR
jgi:F0F1-type ATP synthase membrane subunit b/b'